MTATFLDLVDLASERLGASAIAANDEFFAAKENLIKAAAPVSIEGKYTDRGKWMDGWETRRRRDLEAGTHDWCVIRLGVPGRVRGVNIDTANFKGNAPEACALDACDLARLSIADDLTRVAWREILPRVTLEGDRSNLMAIEGAPNATYLRVRIFPDGGVARLRVYGDVVADWERLRRQGDVDLAAVEHGGVVVACSDMFFGSRHNLIMPGDAAHMGDGWETKRRRGPGHDWTIVRLGAAGAIRRVEVDTRRFKGNAPGACSLEGSVLRPFDELRLVSRPVEGGHGLDEPTIEWRELLPRTPLQPHTRHHFEDEMRAADDVTHVRFNIFPDGGVGRLRLFGRPK